MTDIRSDIQETIDGNDVVLFMKGTRAMPQCGFSSRVVGVLDYMGVAFRDVNVLASDEMRQGIKDFSDWPTVPQLYADVDRPRIVRGPSPAVLPRAVRPPG